MKDTLIINLADINETGKDFDFKKGGDKALDDQLFGVIENLKDYSIHLHLKNAGDIYIADGNYKIVKDDLCSLCGEDLVQNLNTKFTEYLVVEEEKEQEGHAPHSGLNYETDKETYFIESLDLDVFDFLREIMAASVPLYPKCETVSKCEATRAELQAKLEATNRGASPFAVLEKLKKQ